ncbi:hypothetical protein OE88DRAFT_281501 [Heliocybe sulcata]|uniref:F-box domain-containing protein n=1 Tax=Heliocybe sulcata TaxID=5364 RepID=A0A5C3N0T9_9AGAM|nr:hypothetical protein OE88DRAFT_281501 [Heliocybe sulcata]
MAPQSLPIELLEKIVQNADRAELRALSCASCTFKSITEPVLYNSIAELGFRSTVHAILSVLRPGCEYRQGYVRKFSINTLAWAQRAKPELLQGFFRLVAQALESFVKLDELYLLGLPPSEAWVLGRCTAQPIAFVTDIPPGQVLSSWLERQRRMEVLVLANKYMAHWDEHVQVSSSALPNLRLVCAKSNTLQSLIPDRPVSRVVLDFTLDNKGDGSAYEDLKTAFASSARPVHTLGIHFRPAPRNNYITSDLPMFVNKDARLLDAVTFLDIHVPTFRLFDAFCDIAKTVETCPNLSRVCVTGRNPPFDSECDLKENSQRWHDRSSSLSWTEFREPEGRSRRFALDKPSGKMVPAPVADVAVGADAEYEYYSALFQAVLRG